ncbi:branched-chain amino acid transporter AzlD [Nocardiopsis gilva YIM 90087]|uniref:Branched-chain amino acid transporter AzlD n=1 Tax=Nocardiopsis gilva YIM 90087 TaxID=1235441 RepID=A0A223SAA5_9ACTN|nr:AzlD domain-containing protein [Nocardiopsis gilva]ASU85045.1 branched-chain amino acid transporter AzlD [Nocardiopsis gilva YIM 90087]
MSWTALLSACAACLALKMAGFFLPQAWMQHARVRWLTEAVPIVLLSALIATQVFATDQRIGVDERVVGLAAAGVALWLRAPFLVVLVTGAAVTALVRAAVG